MAIKADSGLGRILLALRAGPMSHGSLVERFPTLHSEKSKLLKMGLLEHTASGVRLTEAGRAACPNRREVKP